MFYMKKFAYRIILPVWSKWLCSVDTDECASSPCVSGSCQDGVNGYTCDCDAGYVGTYCETGKRMCPGS